MAWEGRPGVRDWSRRRRSVSRASQDRRLKSDARRNRLSVASLARTANQLHSTRLRLHRGGPMPASPSVTDAGPRHDCKRSPTDTTRVEAPCASTAGHFPRMWLTVKGHFSASSLHHILCGPTTCRIRSATFHARPCCGRALRHGVDAAMNHYLVVDARRSMKCEMKIEG